MSSENHLEQGLDYYNKKVSELEDSECPVNELVEAYINRGTVLMMMESFIAAMSDFEDAIELIEDSEKEGNYVDLGLFIRAYENRGQLCCGEDNMQMVADYSRIVGRLPELRNGTRYFGIKDIVEMCLACSEDLLDESFPENAIPFLEKAESTLRGKHDPWANNRFTETYSLMAESKRGSGLKNDAITLYGESLIYGKALYDSSKLEDPFKLVMDYINRGDIREEIGDDLGLVQDHSEAARILEEMIVSGASCDTELLVNLCQGLASKLMDLGKIADSEKYLLKSMKYGMPEMDEAITSLGLRR